MKRIQFVFALLLGAFLAPHAAHAAEGFSVRAILIRASNDKGPSDARLKQYEAELQRNLVFSSFKFVAENTTAVPTGGRSSISLAGGHRLELENDKGALRGKMQWKDGRTVTVTLQRESPSVLVNRVGDDADAVLILVK
ncbi:MAG TPA: hypothetical protein VM029_02455 [Opitutaceae bacterium]|nr:hypothetical protein [Opitutaceae bacterium]